MPTVFSTNWNAVLASVGIFTVTNLIKLARHGLAAMKAQWKENIAVGLLVTLAAWFLLFGWSVIHIVFADHQSLVAKNHELSVRVNQLTGSETVACKPKDEEIRGLRARLARQCYFPDRHLTQEQKDALHHRLEELRKGMREARVAIGCFVDDSESNRFMGELALVMENAGWKVMPYVLLAVPKSPQDQKPPGYYDGLSISVHTDMSNQAASDRRQAELAILMAFHYAGVEVVDFPVGPGSGANADLLVPKDITIWVGRKKVS